MLTTDSTRAPTTIFIHNLKTGGATLRRIIGRQYDPQAVLTITGEHHRAAELEPLIARPDHEYPQVVQGHIPFGVHELLPSHGVYITLLRNPVDRILSLYEYRVDQRRREVFRGDEPLTLAEYIRDVQLKELDNGQTRRLSGLDPDFGHCSADMLREAKKNLRERFLVVGITEKFDHSLLLLARELGWRNLLYVRLNVTKNKEEKGRISKDLMDLITRHNALDLELYDFAKQAFDERLGQLGAEFEERVRVFKRVNAEYARFDVYASKRRERTPLRGTGPAYTALSWEEQLRAAVFEEHPQLLVRQLELNVEIRRLQRQQEMLRMQVEQGQKREASLAEELREARAREAALDVVRTRSGPESS